MTPEEKIAVLEARLERLENRRRQKFLLGISTAAMMLPLGLWAATVLPNTFSDGETLSAAKLNANFQALAQAGVPAGTIVAYGGSTPPAGWLLCDGSQVSRSTYAALYSAIGNAFGAGDGSSSFHLPDLRGRFLRGVDGTANIDPDKTTRTAMNVGGNTGNLVGSVQGDMFRSHVHVTNKSNLTGSGADYMYADHSIGVQVPGTTPPAGGNETRPVNAYVNFIIKH